ncbi:antitoxin [Saccharomonospora xinjiangensis]|uniref:antitoxin n=1 Tax=Saccharomonospora xinjiangensis TaxID=75294 RepID=UPI0018DEE3A3|nr:antitoxin [Saccharomonospora xinjiangensis]
MSSNDRPGAAHRQARSVAREQVEGESAEVTRSARTGLPVVDLGTAVTPDDVHSLEDER